MALYFTKAPQRITKGKALQALMEIGEAYPLASRDSFLPHKDTRPENIFDYDYMGPQFDALEAIWQCVDWLKHYEMLNHLSVELNQERSA